MNGRREDEWTWWRDALEEPDQIGRISRLLIHPSDYHMGYYRVLDKASGRWDPVGIYPAASGVVVAFRGDRSVDPVEIFSWCCRNPVTFEAYQRAMDGDGWADEPPAPDVSTSDDPFENLHALFVSERAKLQQILREPINTQDQADQVALMAKRLNNIATQADKRHKAEKKPHLEAGRNVDRKWFDGIRDPLALCVGAAREAVRPFFAAEKHRKEQAAADAAKAADEARRAARAAESDSDRLAALARAQELEREASASTKVSAGRTGARMFTKETKVAVVLDYEKAAISLLKSNTSSGQDLKNEIDRLAQRAAKSGIAFDGMEIREVDTVQ